MMKYLNGGIVKEITIFYKNSFDKLDVLDDLADKIDLDLYDLIEYPNCLMLDIKKSVLKNNLCSFLEEFDSNFKIGFHDNSNVEYIKKNMDMDITKLLEGCDDIFIERYRLDDTFSINSDKYMMDVVYYAFYCDGPYYDGNFNNLVRYLHSLHREAIHNILNGALCFGVN